MTANALCCNMCQQHSLLVLVGDNITTASCLATCADSNVLKPMTVWSASHLLISLMFALCLTAEEEAEAAK